MCVSLSGTKLSRFAFISRFLVASLCRISTSEGSDLDKIAIKTPEKNGIMIARTSMLRVARGPSVSVRYQSQGSM